MSGIFGYIGNQDCRDALINGINALDHRGGEVTGMALKIKEDLICVRNIGKVDKIIDDVNGISVDCKIGLAQTSRCNRAKPSTLTASPAYNNMFCVAMDGGIDNFDFLKSRTGNPFPICTDEDLLLALLCINAGNNYVDLAFSVSNIIEGAPTFAFFCSNDNSIYCKKGLAPLFIGVSKDGYYLSSELGALQGVAIRYLPLEDGEIARISADRVVIYDAKKRRVKRTAVPFIERKALDNDYPIGDEVFYCPLAIKSVVKQFVKDNKLDFPMLKLSRHNIDRIDRIIITGEGSSYYSAMLGAGAFGILTDVPTYAVPSGELAYSTHILNKYTLVISVSNSGESISTIIATKRALLAECKTIVITPNTSSYLAQIGDALIPLNEGVANSSSSPNCFMSSYMALAFLALFIGAKSSVVDELYMSVVLKMAESLSGKVSSSVKSSPMISNAVSLLCSSSRIVTTGYLGDNALALEAGLRLRSIANISSINCPLNELECLLGKDVKDSLLIAFISDDRCMPQVMSHLRRARSLGANVLIYTATNIEDEISGFDNIVSVNDSVPLLNPLPIISSFYKTIALAGEDASALEAV